MFVLDIFLCRAMLTLHSRMRLAPYIPSEPVPFVLFHFVHDCAASYFQTVYGTCVNTWVFGMTLQDQHYVTEVCSLSPTVRPFLHASLVVAVVVVLLVGLVVAVVVVVLVVAAAAAAGVGSGGDGGDDIGDRPDKCRWWRSWNGQACLECVLPYTYLFALHLPFPFQVTNLYIVTSTALGWLFNQTNGAGAGSTYTWSPTGCQTVPATSLVGLWSNDMGTCWLLLHVC
jgi:hypothetical protein